MRFRPHIFLIRITSRVDPSYARLSFCPDERPCRSSSRPILARAPSVRLSVRMNAGLSVRPDERWDLFRLSICPSVRLTTVCLSVRMNAEIFVCLSVRMNAVFSLSVCLDERWDLDLSVCPYELWDLEMNAEISETIQATLILLKLVSQF